MTAREILTILNTTDELENVEAKRATKMGKSITETICAFTNTSGIQEGYILTGVVRDDDSLFPSYTVEGVPDPDQFQMDVASQCATIFNRPVHPRLTAERINDKVVVLIRVMEADANRKPLHFKKEGLPHGAWIRVGSTDQRCTMEDLEEFMGDREHFDGTFVDRTSIEDIDERAVQTYRRLRAQVNPSAAELEDDDHDLLLSLDCLADDGSGCLTVAGLLLFGKATTLRRKFPMQRVDYIRVSGSRWEPDPYDRFRTLDMREPLIKMAFRAVSAITDDLPKQFRLEEGQMQAQHLTIPSLALREAVVNALMHRNYRVSGATQIIRYDNRVEIINPGYSLKPEAYLGERGSKTRNPRIAAVLHECNLAEAKGSGIRVMRKLAREAGFSVPTFNSDRSRDEFTARFLLHHFLDRQDLVWLTQFAQYDLTQDQKMALIFIRETGAINNSTYRQLVDGRMLTASQELRQLRDYGLIEKKGKTKGTYYVPTFPSANDDRPDYRSSTHTPAADGQMLGVEGEVFGVPSQMLGVKSEVFGVPPQVLGAKDEDSQQIEKLSDELKQRIEHLGAKATSRQILEKLIVDLCAVRAYSLSELSVLLDRHPRSLQQRYLNPLVRAGRLAYVYPDMKNHPRQAYRAVTN